MWNYCHLVEKMVTVVVDGKKRPLDLNFVDSVLFIWDLVQVLFSSLTFTSEKL